jgi:nitrite reductase (NO-forming)
MKGIGLGTGMLASGSLAEGAAGKVKEQMEQAEAKASESVAADPTDIPEPIDRFEPKTHEVELVCEEVTAEIESGVTFNYMTFGGEVPGPMIRVREGDTIDLTIRNPDRNNKPHNVDFHACYGTGGGAEATTIAPGEVERLRFKAMYPGSFIYHCAVATMDFHISSGMFGMILVEPREGLPEVDHEFYFGQHEVYTDKDKGKEGHHGFDFEAMKAEEPTYVLLNGEEYAYTADNKGPLKVETGDTARVFLVTGGPNVTSNFHPIGNVWSKSWAEGAIESEPEINVQTKPVAPGSCFIGEMEFPVPETVKLVDHALSRVVHKGMMAEIKAEGEPDREIFDPNPDESNGGNGGGGGDGGEGGY